jgi:hypothetical protein
MGLRLSLFILGRDGHVIGFLFSLGRTSLALSFGVWWTPLYPWSARFLGICKVDAVASPFLLRQRQWNGIASDHRRIGEKVSPASQPELPHLDLPVEDFE